MARWMVLLAGILVAQVVPTWAAEPESTPKKPTTSKEIPTGKPTSADLDFFESKVRPLLAERCYGCHSAQKKQEGLLALDSRTGWEKGGASGPALQPGNPDKSLLIKAVRYAGLEMPPNKKLDPKEIAILEQWVKMGAPDPRTGAA